MPSSRGRWALSRGHVAIHPLVWCCCRTPFPAHPTLIPAPWHCCAHPPSLGAAMLPPSPQGSPPDHVQKDVGYGWAHSRLLGSRAHCRGCQVLELLPGPAPRQLLVPAAQSCRDTCCFPSDPPNLVSLFLPRSQGADFFPKWLQLPHWCQSGAASGRLSGLCILTPAWLQGLWGRALPWDSMHGGRVWPLRNEPQTHRMSPQICCSPQEKLISPSRAKQHLEE